jgi:integrase
MRVHRIGTKRTAKVATVERGEAGQEAPVPSKSFCDTHYLSAPRRYTTLQVGTPLIIIRDILGHVDLKSTEIYAKADLELKRQALAKASVHSPTVEVPSWQQNKTLIEWLRSL